MSISSALQSIFKPPSATGDNSLEDDESIDSEWGQNFRIVMAIAVTIISAFIVWWIMS